MAVACGYSHTLAVAEEGHKVSVGGGHSALLDSDGELWMSEQGADG